MIVVNLMDILAFVVVLIYIILIIYGGKKGD